MSKNTVTRQDVLNNMKDVIVRTVEEFGKPTTYVTARMKNGFTVRASTTCVDPSIYKEEIGKQICLKKIEDQIWLLLGYQLQEKLSKPIGSGAQENKVSGGFELSSDGAIRGTLKLDELLIRELEKLGFIASTTGEAKIPPMKENPAAGYKWDEVTIDIPQFYKDLIGLCDKEALKYSSQFWGGACALPVKAAEPTRKLADLTGKALYLESLDIFPIQVGDGIGFRGCNLDNIVAFVEPDGNSLVQKQTHSLIGLKVFLDAPTNLKDVKMGVTYAMQFMPEEVYEDGLDEIMHLPRFFFKKMRGNQYMMQTGGSFDLVSERVLRVFQGTIFPVERCDIPEAK